MTAIHTDSRTAAAPVITVRRIGMADLRAALASGFDDFRALRGDLLFLGLIYSLVGIGAFALTQNLALTPLIFPLAAGLTILGPAVASGFYTLSKRREQGEESGWLHFLDVFSTPRFRSVLALTAILGALFLGWLYSASLLYRDYIYTGSGVSLETFSRPLFTTAAGGLFVVVSLSVGFVFAAIALAVGVVGFPMLVDRPVGVRTAVATSLRVSRENPATVAAWGVIVAGLLFLGSLPLFLGLAFVLPVLGYATWHLYRRAVTVA